MGVLLSTYPVGVWDEQACGGARRRRSNGVMLAGERPFARRR